MSDNVLWIITDDQPRATLEQMPRTWQRLVGRGVRFDRGYAAMPWCGPARASMLTSRYPHHHGCSTNQTHRPFVEAGLDRDTVATRLRAGTDYDTGYFGKYMNGLSRDPEYVAPGWRRWVTTVGSGGGVNVDGETRETGSQRAADRFALDRLTSYLERQADRGPWFAVWSTSTPHDPYTPSRRHRDDFDGVRWDPPALNEPDMTDKPSWMRDLPPQDPARMREVVEGKLEELQDLDDQVARVLDVLRETGQHERTWVFLVSDNGYLMGEHRLFRKEQPYEESAGVPYVVRGPGVAPAVSDALVSQVDLMPTTLEIAGLDPDAGRDLDGRSLLDPLRSGDWSAWRRRLLVENTNLGWAMLREGAHVFVDHHERGERELYDLDADPHQLSSRRDVDVSRWAGPLGRLRTARGRALRKLEE